MSLIVSTLSKVLVILLAAAVVLSVALGGWVYYRGKVIESQGATIAAQSLAIENFKKDRAAQEVSDKQLKDRLSSIQKEKETFKKGLEDALKDSPCTNTTIPDDAKRLLDKLYGSQHSR